MQLTSQSSSVFLTKSASTFLVDLALILKFLKGVSIFQGVLYKFPYFWGFRDSKIQNIQYFTLSTCAKFSEKLTILKTWYAHVRVCIGGWGGEEGGWNVTFSENFAYVRNEWSPTNLTNNSLNMRSWEFLCSNCKPLL